MTNPEPSLPDGERAITMTRETRADTYAIADRLRDKDDSLWIVTWVGAVDRIIDGLSSGHRVDDGWLSHAHARPATIAEIAGAAKGERIAELEQELRLLLLPPDDDRSAAAIARQRTNIKRELSVLR